MGEPKSHFQMYLDAMVQVECNLSEINQLIRSIESGEDVYKAIDSLNINENVKNFMQFTFKIIDSNQPHLIAAAFTFGREDLIPDMFFEI